MTPRHMTSCPEFALAAVAAPHRLAAETGRTLLAMGANAIEAMVGKLAGHSMFQGAALERLKMCGDCRVIDIYSNSDEAKIANIPPKS
jgi:hypothetical protein